MKLIGIRREDKNKWEKRVPLIPSDVKELLSKYNIKTIIQPSSIRIFPDRDYIAAGAEIVEDLNSANLVLAVKEIPVDFIKKNKTYIFFSHTIKGQPYNMPLLKRLMENKCNLIDYETIVNEDGKRLIFFGKYAGVAGMIETLHVYGQKLKKKGISHPFQEVKQAFEYHSIEDALANIKAIGSNIGNIEPVFIGISGYGNVSKGVQEILDVLPVQEITPDQLVSGSEDITAPVVKIIFKESDMVEPHEGVFDLQTYFNSPELYKSKFNPYLEHVDILVNCIYWTEEYPRLVTKAGLKEPGIKVKLEVIGDISCDIEGSIELTYKSTYPDNATFTYSPESNIFIDGTTGDGITVMAIDNLPCEFPRESSSAFSEILRSFVPDILITDFNVDFDQLDLPYPFKEALILHNGQLTEKYKYLEEPLQEHGGFV